MAVGSTFLNSLGLERYGLQWRWPEIDCAHPLDTGDAGVLRRSLDDTAAGLGSDGPRWQSIFGRPSANFDALSEDIMGPLLRLPNHPLALARFGLPTMLPASTFARIFRTEQARALFGGVAAHTFRPLHYPMTSAIGLGIITAGHRHGWPVAAGGSQSITDALAAMLGDLGGKIETGVRIDTASQLPPTDVTMFDLAPGAIADILDDRLPGRVARAFRRFRYGPGAFKVDFAVDGGVPWTNRDAHGAGTVHLGGDFAEIASTERDIHAGRMPDRPFVLVGQQYLADPARSVGDIHPVWTYAHVPHGYTGDATEAIVAQIERFAPGVPGPDRRADRSLHDADGDIQPQLRRRGHRHRGQRHPTAGVRTAHHTQPVPARHSGHVHLLGGHPARARGAWDVRGQRCRRRTPTPPPPELTASRRPSGTTTTPHFGARHQRRI